MHTDNTKIEETEIVERETAVSPHPLKRRQRAPAAGTGNR